MDHIKLHPHKDINRAPPFDPLDSTAQAFNVDEARRVSDNNCCACRDCRCAQSGRTANCCLQIEADKSGGLCSCCMKGCPPKALPTEK